MDGRRGDARLLGDPAVRRPAIGRQLRNYCSIKGIHAENLSH
jgi:hypothetical protein